MTYAGAAGATREEMMRVLHFPKEAGSLHDSFAQLQKQLAAEVAASAKSFERDKKHGGSFSPLALHVANRLYAQRSYAFKTNYFTLLNEKYGTSLVPVDFKKNGKGVTREINEWVEQQTQKRIRDLIPQGALNEETRLVLVNALYFKAAWADSFSVRATTPEPFRIRGGAPAKVPTMVQKAHYGHMKFSGGQAITLPYRDGELQFVILLPDSNNGLAGLKETLTPELLEECASLKGQELILHLPKFRFQPPTISLSKTLQSLGMKRAFDEPRGSADFSEMAVRRPDDYLYISKVFHKTFIVVDEEGTEAAAATAVVMAVGSAMREPTKPLEVKVDRPFVFAIQHRTSGACLFLGHVVDPR